MTYMQFHFIFTLPLMSLFLFLSIKKYPTEFKPYALGMALLSVLALVYTTPWDNYIVAKGVWSYPPDRVLLVIGYVPFEEYLFFLIQTWLSGSFFFLLTRKFPEKFVAKRSWALNISAGVFSLLLCGTGVYFLFSDSTFYLGMILSWVAPVWGLQWVYALDHLVRNIKIVFGSILMLSVYLSVADKIAISSEIWTISDQFTTGIQLFGLPMEEALFFFATNVMVIQGLSLFVAGPRYWPFRAFPRVMSRVF